MEQQITPNQVVAFNLARARRLHGWTQETAAERLAPYLSEPWSRIVYSAAERSITGKRIRQFTADDLVAIAAAFEMPIEFFLTPPSDVDRIGDVGASRQLTPEQLVKLATESAEPRVMELTTERMEEIQSLAGARPGEGSTLMFGELPRGRDEGEQS